MGRWKYVWPMCLTMVLHGLAILIFTKGFLLTRTELPNHSHCSDASQSPCFPSSTSYFNGNLSDTASSSEKEETCWTKPAVNRLVIIVLDALRFDFLAPSTFFKESKPWMDNLQVLTKLASTNGSLARIFKAIADPPTTSLQRLKGLMTGGLPTFIDVGDSFGAPAIVEDNFIHQLVKNGRKVVMMGDDTWMQLFPHHFEKSYPYPSFNVKDLDTVDNGCIDHLLPSLYEEDWDVLISHFLGVDHAGHIFGVDSTQMIEKLKQYNNILERVIEVLQSQSGPGGIHQNTFLVVMGDHGQTLNGDHGGGSDEEVDTAIFAMSFRDPASSISLEFDTSSCLPNLDGKNICISSVQQLDFAVTMSALLGIPFPFGSIGQVNPELHALGAGSWKSESLQMENTKRSNLEQWMRDYVNVLCINSWQVKKYIDIYSASSVLGFSSEEMSDIAEVYAKAEQNWSNNIKRLLLKESESDDLLLPALKKQVDAYTSFLQNFAKLARSKWTEFDLRMMGAGIGIMLASLIFQLLTIKRLDEQYDFQSSKDTGMCSGSMLACFIVVIRACSFLSNSFILEEGKIANFLLATTGILKLRYSIMKENMLLEGIIFLIVSTFCRFAIEVGLSKQAATSAFMKEQTSWVLNLASWFSMWSYIAEVVPMLTLILLAYLLFKAVSIWSIDGIYKYIILTSIASYVLIALQWASESNLLGLALWFQATGRGHIPRLIYGITIGQLSSLMICLLFRINASLLVKKDIITKALAALTAWSSTIMLLSGKQGPIIALASVIGGYCILRLESFQQLVKDKAGASLNIGPFPVMQWSLFAVILFFCTGHWCAFDGLRYGAAFIGFDEFILFRQAILLGLDTFGFSIVLPVFGLALLVAYGYRLDGTNQQKHLLFMKLSQVYMTYGLITAAAATATILCVTIQRRHLMVWGLFAPKFCFDVIGLATTDILICLACLYYLSQANDDK